MEGFHRIGGENCGNVPIWARKSCVLADYPAKAPRDQAPAWARRCLRSSASSAGDRPGRVAFPQRPRTKLVLRGQVRDQAGAWSRGRVWRGCAFSGERARPADEAVGR